MPPELIALSFSRLALTVFAFFAGMTVVSVAMGFAVERALAGSRKIFDLPLFEGQYRFELLGNAVFVVIATVTVTLALRAGVVRFGPSSMLPNRAFTSFVTVQQSGTLKTRTIHRQMPPNSRATSLPRYSAVAAISTSRRRVFKKPIT